MRSLFVTTLVSALSLCGLASANQTPKKPGLTYLYTVNITGGTPYDVGPGPYGDRVVVPIVSGAFSGPKMSGTVVPMGGDWALIDSTGNVTANVRQTFKTNDGAYIQIFESGRTQADGSMHVRLTFETGSPKYYWLNNAVGVGILKLVTNSSLTIDAWMLVAP